MRKSDVSQLEIYLRVKFKDTEARSTVDLQEAAGQTYTSEEPAVHDIRKGCVNLMAGNAS